MFILEITNGAHQGQCVRLNHGQHIVLGRSINADLNFNDHEASGSHARFTWDDSGFSIEDLNSTNGTLLNGIIITEKQFLKIGDFIQVGKTIVQLKQAPPGAALQEFKVLNTNASTNVPKVFSAKTMMASNYEELLDQIKAQNALVPAAKRADYLPSVVIEEEPALSPSDDSPLLSSSILQAGKTTVATAVPSVSPTAAYTTDVDNATRLKTLMQGDTSVDPVIIIQFCESQVSLGDKEEVSTKDKTHLGRETSNDILLEGEEVSLQHCTIERRDGSYVLCDLDSENGSYVNGARVVERKLREGDVVTIANYNLSVVMHGLNLGLAVTTMTDLEEESKRSKTRIAAEEPESETLIGVVLKPSEGKKKKEKKKATDLVWFATSDLDRGVFRARSALLAMACALFTTGYLLATGDSTVLASGALVSVHESAEFTAQANSHGFGGCTSCHIGAGKVSTLKCVTCHEQNRPRMAHAENNLQCIACHKDHQGAEFKAAANATIVCVECHSDPHQNLLKINPQLVEGFRLDAVADSAFHLTHHIEKEVSCSSCHGELVASGPRGARAACGQCHAPEAVSSNQCQHCHGEHPDREASKIYAAQAPPSLPKFHYSAVLWLLALIVMPLGLASILPRTRKVNIYSEALSDKKEDSELKSEKK